MEMLGRITFAAMIPLNLILLVWVWLGRVVFGIGGWFLIILLFTVVPVAGVMLLITSILAWVQPERPRRTLPWQTLAQWATWTGLFCCGLFLPDFGDAPDSEASMLTQVFGFSDRLINLSFILAALGLLVALVAWIALLVLQIVGARGPRPIGDAR